MIAKAAITPIFKILLFFSQNIWRDIQRIKMAKLEAAEKSADGFDKKWGYKQENTR